MQYLILLRGINVGGRKIKMAELRNCFEKAGYENVITVLQTGNVILESNEKNRDQLKKEVEQFLTHTFHYSAEVLVMSTLQLKAVIKNYPFVNEPEFHRYAVFTEKGFEKDLVKQAGALEEKLEAVRASEGIVYWRVQKGHTLDSGFGKYINKASAKHFVTNRNLNTLEKILRKCM